LNCWHIKNLFIKLSVDRQAQFGDLADWALLLPNTCRFVQLVWATASPRGRAARSGRRGGGLLGTLPKASGPTDATQIGRQAQFRTRSMKNTEKNTEKNTDLEPTERRLWV